MADNKKHRGNAITDILAAGSGGLLGAASASHGIKAAFGDKIKAAEKIFTEAQNILNNSTLQDPSKAALEHLVEHNVHGDDAEAIVKGLQANSNGNVATTEQLDAFDNAMRKRLSGGAKHAYSHPRAIMAGSIAAGGALALGSVAALRGNKPEPQSFVAREEERRTETLLMPTEPTR